MKFIFTQTNFHLHPSAYLFPSADPLRTSQEDTLGRCLILALQFCVVYGEKIIDECCEAPQGPRLVPVVED